MSMKDLKHAFKLIEENKEQSDFTGIKDEELIKRAEDVLDLTFPPTYHLFLKQYGCGNIGSFEVNGIIDEKLERPGEINVIWFTLDERKTGAPYNFIIIASTGYGPQYVLDASQKDENGEYPVLLWVPGSPETPTKKVNNDFGEFLLEQVQNALESTE